MKTVVYVQTGKNVKVDHARVTISDIAQVMCLDKNIEDRCKTICVRDLSEKKTGAYVVTAMDLVELITSVDPSIEVKHMGETGVVIQYEPHPSKAGIGDIAKTLFICMVVFFGAGFSIMTFNTDVGTRELFLSLYKEITGVESSGFTEMELLYSVGVGIGVIFFFNHFQFKRKKSDPSVLEVKMCTYEEDVSTAVLKQELKNG